ncbi:MAG: hypothetical protein GY757_47915, partial [bacterium]|nr:hypothetical protein [bacterium]
LDLAADSLTLVEILADIEKHFETFSAPQLSEIKTVSDLCQAAMGEFTPDVDLKPSFLDKPLSQEGVISVDPNKSILGQFQDTFTTHSNDFFTYDAMLGSTTRKTFLLKAAVVSLLIKKKVKGKNVGIMLPALQSTTLLVIASYMAGKIPVMLNWTVGKNVLEHCRKTAGVEVIISAGT